MLQSPLRTVQRAIHASHQLDPWSHSKDGNFGHNLEECLWASSGGGSTLRCQSELDRAIRRLACGQSRSHPWLQKGWPLRLKDSKHQPAGQELAEGGQCAPEKHISN